MDIKYLTRQLELIPSEALRKSITVIGAGAVGSFVVLSLAKMGFEDITVYDADDVSDENINCQFYPIKDIGVKKTTALFNLVDQFTGVKINPIPEYWTKDKQIMSNIVINAADSMTVRKELFEEIIDFPFFFIDARMSSEYALIYGVDLMVQSATEAYRKSLYTNEEAVQERCTAKAVMYTVNLIAGLVCKMVKDRVTEAKQLSLVQFNVRENQSLMFTC